MIFQRNQSEVLRNFNDIILRVNWFWRLIWILAAEIRKIILKKREILWRVSEVIKNWINFPNSRTSYICCCFQCRVMAFLRSVSRCNQSLAVSRKFASSIRSGVQRNGQIFAALNVAKFSRAELLACQKYYIDLRHEINTSCHHNEQKSSMSTVAAVTNKAPLSSATSTSNDQKPERDPLDVSFNDPIAAFKSKTTWELIRAYFVYIMCSSEYLVENNMKVMEFRNDIIWTI